MGFGERGLFVVVGVFAEAGEPLEVLADGHSPMLFEQTDHGGMVVSALMALVEPECLEREQ